MDRENLEKQRLQNLVMDLMKVDSDYQQSEKIVAMEESKNQALIGLLREQVTKGMPEKTGKQL